MAQMPDGSYELLVKSMSGSHLPEAQTPRVVLRPDEHAPVTNAEYLEARSSRGKTGFEQASLEDLLKQCPPSARQETYRELARRISSLVETWQGAALTANRIAGRL